MAIKHTVPASLPTGTSTGKVAGDDWRADHVHVPFHFPIFIGGATAYSLTPLTAGTVEPTNAPGWRRVVDLSNASQMKVSVGQRAIGAGGTSCDFRLQYATNGATQTAWADANNTGSGLNVLTGTANTAREGAWVDLASGAKADSTYVRGAFVIVGTVTTQPTFLWVAVDFR